MPPSLSRSTLHARRHVQSGAGSPLPILSYTPEMMLVRHTMVAGWSGARHSHPHQQLLYMISGHTLLTTPSGTIELQTAESTVLCGGVEHQVTAPVASEVLDVFTPARKDYL